MTDTQSLRRTDIADLESLGLHFDEPWQVVDYFEKIVSKFFGAPFGVTTDCCSHGLELCLRVLPRTKETVTIPMHTYLSVPMTLEILSIPYKLADIKWQGSYTLDPYPIIDAATLWMPGSYVAGSMTVISFQHQKYLPIGRGGMILLDDESTYNRLQRLVRDGRDRTISHRIDNVKEVGFHYHMIPEDAARGIKLFALRNNNSFVGWSWQDYTNLKDKDLFKDK